MSKVVAFNEFKFYREHALLLLSECSERERYEEVQASDTAEEFSALFKSGILPTLILEASKKGSVPHDKINWSIDTKALTQSLKKRETDAVLTPEETKSLFTATENLNVFIKSAKAAGIVVINVSSEDILNGNQGLIFGLTWQIIRLALFKDISVDHHPELIRLLEPGETISSLAGLEDEALLIRWANYHLRGCNSSYKVKGFTSEFRDGVALLEILESVIPVDRVSLKSEIRSLSQNATPEERFSMLLRLLKQLGVTTVFTPGDMLAADHRVYLSVLASLFSKYTGLHILSEKETRELLETLKKSQVKQASLEDQVKLAEDRIVKLETELKEYYLVKEKVPYLEERCKSLQTELEEYRTGYDDKLLNITTKLQNLNLDLKNKSSASINSKLNVKVARVISQSILSTNHNKVDPVSPNTPVDTPLVEISEETPETPSLKTSQTQLDSHIAYTKSLEYLSSIEESLGTLYGVISQREKNLNEIITRLEKLVHINSVMSQKIREYTESFIMQKRGR